MALFIMLGPVPPGFGRPVRAIVSGDDPTAMTRRNPASPGTFRAAMHKQ